MSEHRFIPRGRRLVAGVLLLMAGTACKPLDDALVGVFGRSMRDQSSFSPYENPLLPAEGSVPFAAGNFAPAGEWNIGQPEGDADVPPPFTQLALSPANPAPEVVGLVNPIPANAASLERGEEMYLRTCAPCHGPGGDGQGYIVQTGAYPLIFPLINEAVRNYSDGYIYGMIRVGRGAMPAYAHQVTHQDRWHIVNYVRKLQGASNAASGSDAGAQ